MNSLIVFQAFWLLIFCKRQNISSLRYDLLHLDLVKVLLSAWGDSFIYLEGMAFLLRYWSQFHPLLCFCHFLSSDKLMNIILKTKFVKGLKRFTTIRTSCCKYNERTIRNINFKILIRERCTGFYELCKINIVLTFLKTIFSSCTWNNNCPYLEMRREQSMPWRRRTVITLGTYQSWYQWYAWAEEEPVTSSLYKMGQMSSASLHIKSHP